MQRKSGDAKINYAYIIPYYMLNLSSYLIYSIINSYSACTKYEAGGLDALKDNRGKKKANDSLTEVEQLRAELKLEKAKREKAEMEAAFLKKLAEVERRRG